MRPCRQSVCVRGESYGPCGAPDKRQAKEDGFLREVKRGKRKPKRNRKDSKNQKRAFVGLTHAKLALLAALALARHHLTSFASKVQYGRLNFRRRIAKRSIMVCSVVCRTAIAATPPFASLEPPATPDLYARTPLLSRLFE